MRTIGPWIAVGLVWIGLTLLKAGLAALLTRLEERWQHDRQ